MAAQASVQGGVWDDALSPAFAQGAGPAAPVDVILAVATGPDTTMDIHGLGFNEAQDDRQYALVQLPHNILINASGNMSFSPHVHFTFASEPADGQTVIWKISYVYAKPGFAAETAGTFAAAPTVLTCNTYTTRAGVAEIRKHLVIEPAADVDIPVADCGPSIIFCFTIKLDNSSTIAITPVLLGVDWHYQKGPFGTVGEWA